MDERLTGIAFPFRIFGGVVRSSGVSKIEDNVRHLLSTRLGERSMLRNYGGSLHQRVQSPNDTTLLALIRHEIEQSLRIYMPEVQLTTPVRLQANEAELTIIVEYRADPQEVVRRLQLRIP